MPAPVKKILTEKHLKTLNEVMDMCRETLAYCEDCTRAGMNVDPEINKTRDQLKFCEKLKSVFFPNSK